MSISQHRMSSSLAVQQLWDTITVLRFQRQTPNVNYITKHMAKVYNISAEEVRRQLNYCVLDGLLLLTKKYGICGSLADGATEEYAILKEKVNNSSHDWYCFECHNAGDVISCTLCHRAYHVSCTEDLLKNKVNNEFICKICKNCEYTTTDNLNIIKNNENYNQILYYLADKFIEKLPMSWTERKIETIATKTYKSDRLQFKNQLKGYNFDFKKKLFIKDNRLLIIDFLIFKKMDLQMIKDKAANEEYKNVEEFRADILTFVHNIIILHGVDSSMSDSSRTILRDCNANLEEILKCRYCYNYSIEKKTKFWFCTPCYPPHKLVYVKHKDLLYWPAKVLKIEGDKYEVKYFGGEHKLGIVNKLQISYISENELTLRSRKCTPEWQKACEELRRYQQQLNKMNYSFTAQCSLSKDNDQTEVVNISVQTQSAMNKNNNETIQNNIPNETVKNKKRKSKQQSSEKKLVLTHNSETVIETRGKKVLKSMKDHSNVHFISANKINSTEPLPSCTNKVIIKTKPEQILKPTNIEERNDKTLTYANEMDNIQPQTSCKNQVVTEKRASKRARKSTSLEDYDTVTFSSANKINNTEQHMNFTDMPVNKKKTDIVPKLNYSKEHDNITSITANEMLNIKPQTSCKNQVVIEKRASTRVRKPTYSKDYVTVTFPSASKINSAELNTSCPNDVIDKKKSKIVPKSCNLEDKKTSDNEIKNTVPHISCIDEEIIEKRTKKIQDTTILKKDVNVTFTSSSKMNNSKPHTTYTDKPVKKRTVKVPTPTNSEQDVNVSFTSAYEINSNEPQASFTLSNEMNSSDPHKDCVVSVNKCANCTADASYHCCLSIFYCSENCQLIHWAYEHKHSCYQ